MINLLFKIVNDIAKLLLFKLSFRIQFSFCFSLSPSVPDGNKHSFFAKKLILQKKIMSCANFYCSTFRGSRSKLRSTVNFEEVRPVFCYRKISRKTFMLLS
jgi:hypothetical protein